MRNNVQIFWEKINVMIRGWSGGYSLLFWHPSEAKQWNRKWKNQLGTELRAGKYLMPVVLVSAGIELIFFLVGGTVLCFGFSVRIMFPPHHSSWIHGKPLLRNLPFFNLFFQERHLYDRTFYVSMPPQNNHFSQSKAIYLSYKSK